jgi:hypothetical protein
MRSIPLRPAPVSPRHDVEGLRDVGAGGTLLEIVGRPQGGELFRNRDVDELIESHALTFRHLAGLVEKRGL